MVIAITWMTAFGAKRKLDREVAAFRFCPNAVIQVGAETWLVGVVTGPSLSCARRQASARTRHSRRRPTPPSPAYPPPATLQSTARRSPGRDRLQPATR